MVLLYNYNAIGDKVSAAAGRVLAPHSRLAFAHLFARHSFEFFIEGHLMAFKAIGGTPKALRYDNLKSVVIKRQPLTY